MVDEKQFIEEGKIGEVSWETIVKKTIDWDTSKIRIIGDFEQFTIHWIKTDERWKMEKCRAENCDYCKQGMRTTPRYNVLALDKSDNTVKKVEIGAQVYQQIANYIRNGHRPDSCDFVIKKERAPNNAPVYRVNVVDSTLDVESQLAINEYKREEVPISLLVLDTDVCPKHRIKGEIANGVCKCPNCGHVIWGG